MKSGEQKRMIRQEEGKERATGDGFRRRGGEREGGKKGEWMGSWVVWGGSLMRKGDKRLTGGRGCSGW